MGHPRTEAFDHRMAKAASRLRERADESRARAKLAQLHALTPREPSFVSEPPRSGRKDHTWTVTPSQTSKPWPPCPTLSTSPRYLYR